jgi:DHA1 family tetracycline resistance protein-like MFS transporter
MLARLGGLIGGYGMRRRDLRPLYLALFLSFLGTSIAFPLRLLYAQTHGATPAQLGVLAASFLLAPLVAQLPLGWLVDRWGRVPVLMSGMVGHALISLLYIAFSAPVELIALRFVEGVTIAAIRPAANAYIADVTPEEHRSEAYGVLAATYGAGLFAGPLIGGIAGQLYGFAAAYGLNVAVEVVAVALVWGQLVEPAERQMQRDESNVPPWRALVSLPLAGAYAAAFCTQIVVGFMGSLWTIWTHDLGGSLAYIGATFTVFALPQMLFGATAGRLGDHGNRALLLLVTGVLISSIYLSYGFITNLTAILVLSIVEGLLFVFQGPLAQSLLADASPAAGRGRVQGLAGITGAIGGAAAAFASLPLYHAARPLPWIIMGAVMGLGSLLASLGAAAYRRRRHLDSAAAAISSATR